MKVLMVSNIYPTPEYPGRGSFVKGQVESIRREGVEIELEYVNAIDGRLAFPKSALAIFKRSFLNEFDLIHAHYGTTGIISRLQWRKPVVVSYLGSDILGNPKDNGRGKTIPGNIVALLGRTSSLGMDAVIVKSRELRSRIPKRDNVFIVPNGVDFDLFRPMDRLKARKQLGLDPYRKYVLFPSNATWPRKRYPMAVEAVERLSEKGLDAELVTIYGKSQELIPAYMNACDAMVMASLWEGSPNVVKESMACNLPVVSVHVGDVPEVIGGCEGCHLVERSSEAMASALESVLRNPGRTHGREYIKHLEIQQVARRIISIYKAVLRHRH